jgi:hypothetical protein
VPRTPEGKKAGSVAGGNRGAFLDSPAPISPASEKGVWAAGARSDGAVDDPVQALVEALSRAVAACRAAGNEEAARVAWKALGSC